ncbi:hypothetical protein ACP3TC_04870 [Winslowiella sp. 2C04]|uniref:hypothetical protein n=1 Tax=Winslowiella sp. 2C04 TaxID=3416179 RepID=UPI003CF8BBBE
MKNVLLIEDDETKELLVIPHSSICYLVDKHSDTQGQYTLIILNNGKTQMLDMPVKDAAEQLFSCG